MQEPDEEVEASVSTENVKEDPNLNDTFVVHRKAAKRTLPWDLSVDELELLSPPQAADTPATKRPRLEEPSSASTDEAATTISSHDTAVSLAAAAAAASDNADADPMTDSKPNAGASTRATGYWTPEEDAKLTSAVTNTSKKKRGKEYKTDWVAIAALVPGRTRCQCHHRWNIVLDPSTKRASGRKGKWAEDEDIKLKDAVQTHGEKDWAAIAALVPGRAGQQCRDRWNKALTPSIDEASGRTGKWTAVEDSKLKDAIKTHGGKKWGAIAALVPGRTENQCYERWRNGRMSVRVNGQKTKTSN
jgi:hypothetical protein